MKKILLLGGSAQQISAIEYANKKGYYTIVCDYLSDNPGQHFAKKYYCVSTTDKLEILKIAKKEEVDGIVAYASDPAAPTAAFVAEKLGLPTNPYNSVEILSYKDKFRNFLQLNGFDSPKSFSISFLEDAKDKISKLNLPLMVKPIDSSGSKGVSKIYDIKNFSDAFEKAINYSNEKRVVVEEYIVQNHKYMIGGDCFVLNGKIIYWGLLNCHRNFEVNPLVPVGKSYPLMLSYNRIEKAKSEVQRLVDLLEIKSGAFNLEIMIDSKDHIFIIEMGPRNGGNMIPELLNMIDDIDLVAATVECSLGNQNFNLQPINNEYYYSTYNLHSSKDGIFSGINYKKGIEKNIIKKILYKETGEPIQYFDGSNKAIGILFFKFKTQDELFEVMENPYDWFNIIIEQVGD